MKLFLTTIGLAILTAIPAIAVPLRNHSVQSNRSPLVSTTTIRSSVTDNGFYAFTLTVPAETLAAVIISPSRSIDRTAFDLNRTEAFLGTAEQLIRKLALQVAPMDSMVAASASTNSNVSNGLKIEFAQPISPGTTLTINLKPSQVPSRQHEYQFDVAAVPVADRPEPIFVGYGNFDFRGDRYRQYPFWWSRDRISPLDDSTDHRVLFWDLPPEFDIRLRHRLRHQN